MKEYKAYIFDMDLTLLNALECSIISYIEAYKAVGGSFDQSTIYHHLAMPLRNSYAEIENPTGTCEEFIRVFSNVSADNFKEKTFYYEDSFELLRKLKANGKIIGIVTNREGKNLETSFDVFPEMRELVNEYVTCEKVKELKPSPEPLLLCLKLLNVKPEEAVYVGDAHNDYRCAKAAGVDYIEIERYNNCNFDCPIIVHDLNEIY